MTEIIRLIVLGISITASIGPVAIITIKRGLEHGFCSAFITNMGAVVVDGIYLILIHFGLSALFNIPSLRLIFGLLGVLILFYLGFHSIKDYFAKHPFDRKVKKTFGSSFLTGITINISNPLAPIAWLGFYGIFSSIYEPTTFEFLLKISWVLVGATIWGATLSLMAHIGKRFANERIMQTISLIAGIILFGFGLYLGYHVVLGTKS